MAAAIFWLFNAFNKSHSSTIRFPLHFEYNSQRFVAVQPLPHHISINVKGSGWDLIRRSLGIKLPELIIPLERPLDTRKMATSSLTPILISQLGGLQINFMVTDTLYVQLDEKISKTFHLTADLSKVSFREGFGSSGTPDVNPDTVVIDGPRSIVTKIPDTILLPVTGNQISKSFQDEVEVPLFNSVSIKRNPPVISVRVEVVPVKIIETRVKVKTINQPRAARSSFTDSVKVVLRIPTEQREDLKEKTIQFKAIFDLKDIPKGSHRLYPKIIGLPVYVQVVSIDSVTFKID
jgi:YbbR domain-containing protein